MLTFIAISVNDADHIESLNYTRNLVIVSGVATARITPTRLCKETCKIRRSNLAG